MTITDFKTLPISTQTVMAYINCRFNIENIETNLEYVSVPNLTENDLKKVKGKHGEIYQIKGSSMTKGVPARKGHFRNQITVKIFIIDKIVTIKIFRTGKFHLTGCKDLEHQRTAAITLMNKIRGIHSSEQPTFFMENEDPLNIILEVVMTNIDFRLDFNIDQIALDSLIQHHGGNDFYTVFETTVNTSVNVKMDYDDPQKKTFEKIIFKNKKVEYSTTNECPKMKVRDTRVHTFLVFNSSKVIQSGRFYESEMETAYLKFNKFLNDNKNQIEMKINNCKFDINQLNL